jgi:hypothetical protein
MAFVVEDGTGLPDANSYADVDFADEYFVERGYVAWTGGTELKKTWLVQATDYIEQVFAWRFAGSQMFPGVQGLAYPRKDVVLRDGTRMLDGVMPVTLLRATCQYALRAKTGPLMPDPLVDKTGFLVVTTRKKVGPIEKEFQVMGSSGQPILIRSYPFADGLLSPLLCASGRGGTRVIR